MNTESIPRILPPVDGSGTAPRARHIAALIVGSVASGVLHLVDVPLTPAK